MADCTLSVVRRSDRATGWRNVHNEWIIDKEIIFNWIQIHSWTNDPPERGATMYGKHKQPAEPYLCILHSCFKRLLQRFI